MENAKIQKISNNVVSLRNFKCNPFEGQYSNAFDGFIYHPALFCAKVPITDPYCGDVGMELACQ